MHGPQNLSHTSAATQEYASCLKFAIHLVIYDPFPIPQACCSSPPEIVEIQTNAQGCKYLTCTRISPSPQKSQASFPSRCAYLVQEVVAHYNVNVLMGI